jgi:hypothetical protein
MLAEAEKGILTESGIYPMKCRKQGVKYLLLVRKF